MRNPLSDIIVDIPPSGIRKFFDVVSEMKGAISLGVGEPDFDTPWHVREEGIYSLENGRTFYKSNAGLKELKQEIGKYLKRRMHIDYDYNTEILVTVGGSEAIDIALRAMLNPGEEVLIPQPSYVSYVPCAVLAGGKPVIIELEEKDQFKLTKEKLLEKITPNTKVLILPFPNNPTGAIMEREDLEEIAKVIEEKDIFVISDELYAELTYKGEHVSIAAIPGMRERTVLINGFSKAYAMTGWRIGYTAASKELTRAMIALQGHITSHPSTVSQWAGVEALKHCGDNTSMMAAAYRERMEAAVAFLREELPQISFIEPKGAFYLFLDISSLKDCFGEREQPYSTAFTMKLLNEKHVAVAPGAAFGMDGFIRIAYAADKDTLLRGLGRIRDLVKELRREW